MTTPLTIERPFHLQRGRRSRIELQQGNPDPSPPPGRIPRISHLMALAIRFNALIRDGVITDQAELARLGHVTRARLTQIMNLLNFAPDIQEQILFLRPINEGRAPITERDLRPIVAEMNWNKQRMVWQATKST